MPLAQDLWSSPFDVKSIHWIDFLTVSPRQAHNLKAAGSNPAPATKNTNKPVAAAAGFDVLNHQNKT